MDAGRAAGVAVPCSPAGAAASSERLGTPPGGMSPADGATEGPADGVEPASLICSSFNRSSLTRSSFDRRSFTRRSSSRRSSTRRSGAWGITGATGSLGSIAWGDGAGAGGGGVFFLKKLNMNGRESRRAARGPVACGAFEATQARDGCRQETHGARRPRRGTRLTAEQDAAKAHSVNRNGPGTRPAPRMLITNPGPKTICCAPLACRRACQTSNIKRKVRGAECGVPIAYCHLPRAERKPATLIAPHHDRKIMSIIVGFGALAQPVRATES
jgi:hypothetical protein